MGSNFPWHLNVNWRTRQMIDGKASLPLHLPDGGTESSVTESPKCHLFGIRC